MDWPIAGGGVYISAGEVLASSEGTTLDPGGIANTKGAWANLVASAPFNAAGFILTVHADSLGPGIGSYLFDIGVGSGPTIIVPNMLIGGTGDFSAVAFIPIPVPAGGAIQGRAQSTNTAADGNLIVQAILVRENFTMPQPFGAMIDYGAALADSGGTQVDPGTPANTKAAWSQIVAATVRDHNALMIALGGQALGKAAADYLFDIGVGPAGAETVIIGNINAITSAADDSPNPPWRGPFYVSVPSGSRLAVRAQSSDATSSRREIDVVLYGFS